MKNKQDLNKMKKAFFKVPNRVFDIGLSATAIGVYAYLIKMPEDFNPSIGVIAKSLFLSKTTVVKYMKELKDRNLITCIQPGGTNLITKYQLNRPDIWK